MGSFNYAKTDFSYSFRGNFKNINPWRSFVFNGLSCFIVTADAKPIRGHKHYRHAPKIHKKNKVLKRCINNYFAYFLFYLTFFLSVVFFIYETNNHHK